MTGDRLDACSDAAALARAVHDRDSEAVRILLDCSDTRAVAEQLARALVRVVGEMCGCGTCIDEFLDAWQETLRERRREGAL